MKSSQDLTKAQTLLSNLNVENLAAQQKRQQIRLDTEAETKKLLAERKKFLESIEDEVGGRVSGLKALEYTQQKKLDKAKLEEIALLSVIEGLKAEITSLNDILASVKKDIHDSEAELQLLESRRQGVVAQLEDLTSKVDASQTQISDLTHELEHLESAKIILVAFTESKTKEFEAKKIESERELSILQGQSNEIRQTIIADQSDWDLERQNLATRSKAVKEREEAVENRERKVRRDEETNRRNYQLMSL